MTLAQNCHPSQLVPLYYDCSFYYGRNQDVSVPAADPSAYYNYIINLNQMKSYSNVHDYSRKCQAYDSTYTNYYNPEIAPSAKRRKISNVASGYGINSCQQPLHDTVYYQHPSGNQNFSATHSNVPKNICSTINAGLGVAAPITSSGNARCSTSCKRDRSMFEEEKDVGFMSRDEIERCSPSRKDGIDSLRETHLRYSYCVFLQNLGYRLDVPQLTISTATVLCHRFFVRRSHACHDRFLIATAALFLVAKSEETARPLNDVLLASSEILHKIEFTSLSCMLPDGWFEQYREQVLEAEQLILTTLNFELNVQHPYAPLTSTLEKLGLAQTVLVKLALNLVSEGVCSRISTIACHILIWLDMLCSKCFLSHLKLNARVSYGCFYHDDTLSTPLAVIKIATYAELPVMPLW